MIKLKFVHTHFCRMDYRIPDITEPIRIQVKDLFVKLSRFSGVQYYCTKFLKRKCPHDQDGLKTALSWLKINNDKILNV